VTVVWLPHSVPGTKFPPVLLLRYYFTHLIFNNFPPPLPTTSDWKQEARKPIPYPFNNLLPKEIVPEQTPGHEIGPRHQFHTHAAHPPPYSLPDPLTAFSQQYFPPNQPLPETTGSDPSNHPSPIESR